jgi:hypothetical protein
MDTLLTTRRLIAAGALVVTDLHRAFYDDAGKPTSRPRFVPQQIRGVVNGHTITVAFNGCRPDSLMSRAHVKRTGERSDAMTDYFPGCWTNLKHAIAHATAVR